MSDKFNVLKEEINEGFYEVVGIINEIICHRTETFSEMLELSEDIHEGSEEFIKDTGKIIDTISSEINKKIEKLNIDKMKEDIEEATETFIAITEELELLSYNTICRTMALGEKGASITHISKEIKKYSTTVKDLLENITKNFNGMFVKFKNISDSLMDNQLIPEQVSIGAEDTEELVISSDVSVLIENSQFHDIYMQELEIINDAVSKTEFSDAYEAGRIFGVYEKAISKLDRIKHDLQDKLESIKDVMRDFMYSFNTDLQNMVSKTNILSLELSKISEVSQQVNQNIETMKENVAETKDVLYATHSSIDFLAKQSKTFRNLVVITAVEVARINDESLRSVVVSMNETEGELIRLIDKLYDNISIWESLRNEFVSVFENAGKDLEKVGTSNINSDKKKITENTESLDSQLENFHQMFASEKYVRFFDSNTSRLMELFDEFNGSVESAFAQLNDRLGDDILSSDEFTKGRNEAELKDILADDGDQSSVEFF